LPEPVDIVIGPGLCVIAEECPARAGRGAEDGICCRVRHRAEDLTEENFLVCRVFFFDDAPERFAHEDIFLVNSALKSGGRENFFVIAHQSTACAPRWCGISQ
jgi:hypothetical protein